MRNFFLAFAGMFAAILFYLMVIPFYSDYRAAAETDTWIKQLAPIKDKISSRIAKDKTVLGSGASVDRASLSLRDVSVFEITDSGALLIKGGREGQFVMLIPTLIDGQVSWRCVGGPTSAMPEGCH